MAAAVPLFEKHDRRDDLALLKVVKGLPPVLRKGVNNPVDDSESLTDRLRKASKERDLVEEAALAFERLGSLLEGALAASNAAQACEWMRQAFGPRFPNCPERVKVVSEPPAAAKSTVLGGLMAAGAALAAANPTRPVPTSVDLLPLCPLHLGGGYRPHPCLEIQLGPLHLPDVPWPLEEQRRQKQCRPGDGVTVVAVDRAHQVADLIRFDDRRDVSGQHRLQCAAQIRSGAALTTSGRNAVSKHLPAGFQQRVR